MLRFTLSLLLACSPSLFADAPLAYPDSHPTQEVESLHGQEVADPYRWLEDITSKKTASWVTAQNKVTHDFLSQIPGQQALTEHLTKLWDYERYGIPFKEGGRYFFSKNDGLQNQSVLYTTGISITNPPEVLLDPNTLSEDGTIALKTYSVSPDGKHLAYAISKSGSDWIEWKVRDIATKQDLADHLQWSKFSGASWSKDGKGFYYGRYAKPEAGEEFTAKNTGKKVYYHQLHTTQAEDTLIYERPDQPNWGFYAFVTDDGRYLMISVSQGTDSKNGLFYKDLTQQDSDVVELLPDFDASYRYLTNIGSTLHLVSDRDAPRKKVLSIDLDQPAQEHWKTIIPENSSTLSSASHVGGIFIAKYMKDARSVVHRYQTDGTFLGEVELPGLGSVGGFWGRAEDSETFYAYSSFTEPGTVFHYDIASNTSTTFKQTSVPFGSSNYLTKQVFFTSKDGTRVPMFIVHKKDITLDGKNPTYLYGYGGFNISLTPNYSPSIMTWLDMGGIYAVPNLRDGGEYGEQWHRAGMLSNKQNVFDDFISAAEYLIKENYTSSKKLAIAGGSNGGLLVGACMVQRPELYGACLPAVGVMDMLRFHKFTIGWAWTAEYGSPEEPEAFKNLKAYSPYHNLKQGQAYPATLITTSDHDDRVVPSHSFKFAAALQAANKGPNPMLIRVETKSGHGAGTPTSKRIEEAADKFSFLSKELDFPIPFTAEK